MSNPIFNIITPIRYELGEVQYRATGFYYKYAGEYFLITNRHVLEHEHGISPDRLRILMDFKIDGNRETRPVYVDLSDTNKWLTHPSKPRVDLAAVPLELDLGTMYASSFSSRDHIPQDTNLTIVGSGAAIVGVPGPIGPGESNSPVFRAGMVSSSYGRPFSGEPCFLIDASLHDGMSGSPVLLQTNSMYHESEKGIFDRSEFPKKLLGIHSGPVDQANSYNLHRVWYPNLIWDIISSEY